MLVARKRLVGKERKRRERADTSAPRAGERRKENEGTRAGDSKRG